MSTYYTSFSAVVETLTVCYLQKQNKKVLINYNQRWFVSKTFVWLVASPVIGRVDCPLFVHNATNETW